MLEEYQTFLGRSGASSEMSIVILIYSVQDKNCNYLLELLCVC